MTDVLKSGSESQKSQCQSKGMSERLGQPLLPLKTEGALECRQLTEDAKGKKTFSPLEPPEGNTALPTS